MKIPRMKQVVDKQATTETRPQQSYEELRALIDLTPIPISWADMEGNVLHVNQKFSALFGYTCEDIPTLEAWYLRAYPDPAYRVQLIPAWQACVAEAIATRTEVPPMAAQITCKDGSTRDVAVNCAIVHDKILAVFNDLTEHKQREADLQSSENFLNAIIDGSPYPMWIADPVGRLVRINPSCCRLLGIVKEDVLGRYNVFEDRIVIEKGLVPLIRTAFEQGNVIRFDLEYEASHLKWLQTGPCPFVILDITMYPIKNSDGTLKNVAVQHIDITERRLAEEALRKSEERFRGMAEQLLDVLFQTDMEGVLTYLSPSVSRVMGWNPEEMIGRHVVEFLQDDQKPEILRAFQEVLTSGVSVHNLGLTLKRKDGSVFFGEINGSQVVRDGNITGVLGLIRDITEHKEAEAAREKLEGQLRQAQKMEAVGQLAGGIAHDFNNLLQVILGHLDLVRADMAPGSSNIAELDEISKAAERAADLTRQLLAFSRRQVIQPVNLYLNELVQGILNMVRRVIGEHIELRLITDNRLGTIRADRGQIEQVLMNLCVNARDAMPSGGTLTIETRNETIDNEYCHEHPWSIAGRYVLLSVSDTGCGMDSATLGQVFEPFFTTKGVGQGTGLGLATVYGIVKQHNGQIYVYSEPEKGSIFKIYLPLVESSPEELQKAPEEPVAGGTEIILVAEDEEAVRNLIRRMLEAAGYTVLTAFDGEDALRVFEEHKDTIDMAIFDVIMPKLGGRDVMDRIQATHPKMRFLFSSGYSENAIHTNFVIKEGLRLISKPYSQTSLLRAVRETLDAP